MKKSGLLASMLFAASLCFAQKEMPEAEKKELSTALAGLPNDHAIVQILAKQLHAVADGEYVELNIKGTQSFSSRIPDVKPPTRPPELVVPIEAARGVLGEIHDDKRQAVDDGLNACFPSLSFCDHVHFLDYAIASR